MIGEAGNVPDALRLVDLRHPHVLVLDLNMPGPPSLTAIAEVKDTCAVVVLTMQSDPAFAREALRAGARAYVLKEAAGAELVTAIRVAAEGGIYLNPTLGARIAVEPDAGPPALDDLSDRELDSTASAEVLALLRRAADEFGQTIVMVTHDASAASYADRLVVLADGRIVRDEDAGDADVGPRAHEDGLA